MNALFDSFWRAAAYCLLPRVVFLSFLPLVLISALAAAVWYFLWDPTVLWVQACLESSSWLGQVWKWLGHWGVDHAAVTLAPVLVMVGTIPLVVVACLLSVGVLLTPAMVELVARRRFASLERRHGGSALAGLLHSLGCTVAAVLALIVSLPLWLIPPLVLVLPPLIWGWLTYRVMAFDALAEHAGKDERLTIYRAHRLPLLLMGVVCGFLGAAPAIVWASGMLFVAAFFVLVPVAIWIYTLVFAFSSLWFTHYCLATLQQLRTASPDAQGGGPAAGAADGLLPAAQV